MTDLMPAPAWHTIAPLVDPERVSEAESRRADAERDRADGAEAHLRAALVHFVISPWLPMELSPLSEAEAFEVAEALIADMDRGVKITDLDPEPYLDAVAAKRALPGSGEIAYGPDGFTPTGLEVPF